MGPWKQKKNKTDQLWLQGISQWPDCDEAHTICVVPDTYTTFQIEHEEKECFLVGQFSELPIYEENQ